MKRKRAFNQSVLGWVVLNIFMVAIWFFTGRGYFWPIWTMLGMGVAVVIAGFAAYGPAKSHGITEADVDAEVKKMQGGN